LNSSFADPRCRRGALKPRAGDGRRDRWRRRCASVPAVAGRSRAGPYIRADSRHRGRQPCVRWRTALISSSPAQPVSVHVPARTTPGRPVETRGAARHSGRSAIVANGSRLTRDHRSPAGPSRPVSWPGDRRATSFFPRMSSRSGTRARHDRQITGACAGGWPVERAAVEHPVRVRLQPARAPLSGIFRMRTIRTRDARSRSVSPRNPDRARRAVTRAPLTRGSRDDDRVRRRGPRGPRAIPPARRAQQFAPADVRALRGCVSPCISPSGFTGRTRSASRGGPEQSSANGRKATCPCVDLVGGQAG